MIFLEIVVVGHSEFLVDCFIRNGFRVESLKMRQTLEKWTWRNTYSCSGSNRPQSEFHDLLSSDWVDTLLVPDPISEFEDCVPGFGIGIACLVAMMIGQSSGLEALRSSILTDFHLPLTSLDFYLSTTCPRKYNLKYKHKYKYGWKYGFLLLLRSLDSNLPSMCSRLLLRPPSQFRGSIYADTCCILYTQ